MNMKHIKALVSTVIPLLLLPPAAGAQHGSGFGFSASNSISGNGHGGLTNLSVTFSSGRSEFFAGAALQHNGMARSGWNFKYEYFLNPPQENERSAWLYCFCRAAYQDNAILGKVELRRERALNPEMYNELGRARFKTIESYAGFGLNKPIGDHFLAFGEIGVGAYTTTNYRPWMTKLMYRECTSASLFLSIGIHYLLK